MFRYDNTFFKIINKGVDCFYASILWIIFLLPVVTAGASTTALYYTVHKVIKGNRGYVWKDFWKAFKEDGKGSLWITIIIEVLFCAIVYDKRMMFTFLKQHSFLGPFYYVFYFMEFALVVWGIYICTYRARFSLNWKNSLKNGIFLFLANFPWSIVIGVIVAASAVIVSFSPFFIFLLPALDGLLLDCILEKIYRKFMSEEELAREKELDMERKR